MHPHPLRLLEGLLHEEELVDEPPVVHPWLTEQAQKPTPDALVVVMDAVVPAYVEHKQRENAREGKGAW